MTEEFAERGQRLWENFMQRDPYLANEDNPMREVAISACHTADRVAKIEEMCKTAPPVVDRQNGEIINPLFVECRNQAILMARLVAALRMPDPVGVRDGVHALRGVKNAGRMSALERSARRAG